ncbi:MAG: hypothetical protein DMG67_07980 [Acidobacteria bacterium]|nr:MAG: hypothetical protein DMG67_07980 [Acidobacteriota bacterium]
MTYQFHEIDLFIFDVHFTLKPLITAALLQDNFRFLVDPDLYAKQYSQEPIKTGNFIIRPLTARERKREHFWKYYGGSAVTASTDIWSLNLPFACTAKNVVSPAAPPKSFTVSLQPVIYLYPLGWSVNVECRLEGKIDENELIDFIGALRNASKKPFKMNQKEYSLSKGFEALSMQLKKDLFIDPNAAEDTTKTSRQMVISLSQFTGPIQHYRSNYAQDARMADADRALMHSILLGEKITIPDLAKKESGSKFMLTKFGGASFAISYFDIGTLIFMAEEAQPEKQRRKSIGCMASNIRNFSMISFSLLAFYEELADIESSDTKITALQQVIKQRLIELRKRYNNALCRTWYQNYARLTPFAKK